MPTLLIDVTGWHSFRTCLSLPETDPDDGPEINGLVFTSYSFFMRLQIPRNDPQEPSLSQICAAGAGSGVVSACVRARNP